MLDLEFFQLSDPGLERDQNEDCLGFFQPPANDHDSRGWLFALADGVGGHERGEVASRLAVDAVISGFGSMSPVEPLTSMVPKLLQAANTKVYEAAISANGRGGRMATTLVTCALRYDRALIAHAGDSRCYLIREGRATCLTRDHTVSNEQLRLGLITNREAGASSVSHVLTRALGGDMFLKADISEHQILAGDLLVLCSDGLHHSVQPDDVVRLTAGSASLEAAAHALVELAKARDGGDNISVQLIRIRSVERVGMYRGRHYRLP